MTRALRALHLRFPTLFVILLVLTIVDFLVPDPVPVLDEVVLAVLTVIFGLWRERRSARRVNSESPRGPARG